MVVVAVVMVVVVMMMAVVMVVVVVMVAHAGPSLWNTLPVHLKNRNLTLTTFMRHLTCKSYFFSPY